MRNDRLPLMGMLQCLVPLGLALVWGCGSEELNPQQDAGAGAGAASSSSSASSSASSTGTGGSTGCDEPVAGTSVAKRAILFVWDGLRPDVINAEDTPNLYRMSQEGSYFQDNHSTYPTFTMMNASSFATGSFPGTTGFYGNTLWAPGTSGRDAAGNTVDFNQPVFTEDYGILSDLDAFFEGQLLMVGSLFQAAQAAGLKTAAIGKSGPAFLQDYKKGGTLLDERLAYPLSFAQELQAANVALPKLTPNAYEPGQLTLSVDNGDPTASSAKKVLTDGVSSDPTDVTGTPYQAANEYLMDVFLSQVLPKKSPDLTVIWLRNPDSTQHNYGVGTHNAKDALRGQDLLLGRLRAALTTLGLDQTTNLIIASDHGHSNVSGPADLFPLRAITGGVTSDIDPQGFSASGDVRLADLLTRAGFTAFDGGGCIYAPVMSGIKADGSPVYPTQIDADGSVCGTADSKYTTRAFKVPPLLPLDAVVVAANGGSEYLYLPDHDAALVSRLVTFLQTRLEYGAIFVGSRYGGIEGTLPLDLIKGENQGGRSPDIIVSYTFDENAVIQGVKGIEFESMGNSRGMHGSFSPIDVHNTLLAAGPDFRSSFVDELPTGNVDVAPTLAFLLGLSLPQADGRPLYEALKVGIEAGDYQVKPGLISSSRVTGLSMKQPTSPDGADVDPTRSSYGIELHTKTLTRCSEQRTYFDVARAVRQ